MELVLKYWKEPSRTALQQLRGHRTRLGYNSGWTTSEVRLSFARTAVSCPSSWQHGSQSHAEH
jgi:hypothetical protein